MVAGLLLALIGFTSANLYCEWQVFGGYDKEADVLAFLALALALVFWMPGLRRT